MAGVLIHDGRRVGHMKWSTAAVAEGSASGIIISPFSTPRFSAPRKPSGSDLTKAIRSNGGEVIFDASTHARLLPTTTKLDCYDTWDLWQGAPALRSPVDRRAHIERVFAHQAALGVPFLTPTMSLSSPLTAAAEQMVATAVMGRSIDGGAWQSLAGSAAFWASGARLDAFVGQLSTLKARVWVLTFVNDVVLDQTPDLSNVEAHAGFCRTVHSLSERSRVIVAHSDFAGLPAVAAGADTVGSGWDRSMRTFDPVSYKLRSDDSPRIPASYVTQAALHAVLRRDAADAIQTFDPKLAEEIRGGSMPLNDQMERHHHLTSLNSMVEAMVTADTRHKRVDEMRNRYEVAGSHFDLLIDNLSAFFKSQSKASWATRPSNVLESYARAENLWD